MYRMCPLLYEMRVKDYKKEKMKLNVWEKIAEEVQHVTGCCVQGMGATGSEVIVTQQQI